MFLQTQIIPAKLNLPTRIHSIWTPKRKIRKLTAERTSSTQFTVTNCSQVLSTCFTGICKMPGSKPHNASRSIKDQTPDIELPLYLAYDEVNDKSTFKQEYTTHTNIHQACTQNTSLLPPPHKIKKGTQSEFVALKTTIQHNRDVRKASNWHATNHVTLTTSRHAHRTHHTIGLLPRKVC